MLPPYEGPESAEIQTQRFVRGSGPLDGWGHEPVSPAAVGPDEALGTAVVSQGTPDLSQCRGKRCISYGGRWPDGVQKLSLRDGSLPVPSQEEQE